MNISKSRSLRTILLLGSTLLLGYVAACLQAQAQPVTVPKWGVYEATLESAREYANPIQEIEFKAIFVSPTGKRHRVYGFWDGGRTWKVRFSPDETGQWTFSTRCSDTDNDALHNQEGRFVVGVAEARHRFSLHGPIEVSRDGRYFQHQDGTPYFWLADTAWNGPLKSTDADWNQYLRVRLRQKFNAIQWVATQWRAAPEGDRQGRKAFSGREAITIHPEFFQRLDQKVKALSDAGFLNVPVMLWAIGGGSNPQVNPGFSLPEDQAVRLARYMVARWQAWPTVWVLPGDGDYRGEKAMRWKRIGLAVFGNISHAPAMLHPGGMQWHWDEFKDEGWLGAIGYQSGHGDDARTLRWMQEGPATEDWMRLPHRPFINLEPPYEDHLAYHSKEPHSAFSVRRAIYWCLLNAPPAGTSYGAHGVWGWDDGSEPPTDHPGSGTPKPWHEALELPGANQMAHVYETFASIDFWRLRPAPVVVVNQPGKADPAQYVAAAKTDQKDLCIVYVPSVRTVEIKLDALPPSPNITWINPRTGEQSPAVAVVTSNTCQFPTPEEGDWILLMRTDEAKKAAREQQQP